MTQDDRESFNNEPIKERIIRILLAHYGTGGPNKEEVAFEILASISDPTQVMIEAGASLIESMDGNDIPSMWELWEDMLDAGLTERISSYAALAERAFE